ncbi:MAG: NAD-dependent epimerase/dehydratase family protein [Lachnospiraceae bacterium]|nr:NAD-dependent epimerase/dehydratase family protein [Lachnospiraceae bacterium]
MRKKCLILGGSGFMGKNLTLHMLEKKYEVTLYDRKVRGIYTEEDLDHVRFHERELFVDQELGEVIDGQDVVVHLVSSVGPESSMSDPERCYYNDVAKTAGILETMRGCGVDKMLFISSGGTVYGNRYCESFKEDMPLYPMNHYGITKVAIEKMLHMYNEVYGMKNIALRVSNPYGVGQQSGKGIGTVTIFGERIMKGQPITIWGDGNTVRDYIYIEDLINIIIKFIEFEGMSDYRVYNVGTGVGTSLNELVAELERQIGKKADVAYEPPRAIDVRRNVLNMEKTFGALGKVIQYPLRDGIQKYLNMLK